MLDGAVGTAPGVLVFPTHICPTQIMANSTSESAATPSVAGPWPRLMHLLPCPRLPLPPSALLTSATCAQVPHSTLQHRVPHPRLLLCTVPRVCAGGAARACCWLASSSRCGERGQQSGGQGSGREWHVARYREGPGSECLGMVGQAETHARTWQRSMVGHCATPHVT